MIDEEDQDKLNQELNQQRPPGGATSAVRGGTGDGVPPGAGGSEQGPQGEKQAEEKPAERPSGGAFDKVAFRQQIEASLKQATPEQRAVIEEVVGGQFAAQLAPTPVPHNSATPRPATVGHHGSAHLPDDVEWSGGWRKLVTVVAGIPQYKWLSRAEVDQLGLDPDGPPPA